MVIAIREFLSCDFFLAGISLLSIPFSIPNKIIIALYFALEFCWWPIKVRVKRTNCIRITLSWTKHPLAVRNNLASTENCIQLHLVSVSTGVHFQQIYLRFVSHPDLFTILNFDVCFHFKGAHINPAVTFGMVVIGAISPLRAAMYITAHCGGGIAGAALLYG